MESRQEGEGGEAELTHTMLSAVSKRRCWAGIYIYLYRYIYTMMVQWDKQMQTCCTETQRETAEQKQTHGSGRILKPGPYSIKASLGPSSLEAPPLLCCRLSRPVDILSLSLFLLLPLFLGRLLSSFLTPLPPALSLSSPALPASLYHPPSSSLHLLLHRYDCSGCNVRSSKGGEAWVCPRVCLRLSSSPIHS